MHVVNAAHKRCFPSASPALVRGSEGRPLGSRWFPEDGAAFAPVWIGTFRGIKAHLIIALKPLIQQQGPFFKGQRLTGNVFSALVSNSSQSLQLVIESVWLHVSSSSCCCTCLKTLVMSQRVYQMSQCPIPAIYSALQLAFSFFPLNDKNRITGRKKTKGLESFDLLKKCFSTHRNAQNLNICLYLKHLQ